MGNEKFIFRARDRAATPEDRTSHPWNPNSEIVGHMLGDRVGLKRIGIHHVTIPPEKESFVFHSHQTEEEFVFVLSGRAVIEIDDETFELEPGDFVGFPTPSAAHHIRNPFAEPFTYLTGGERNELEIADYPRHGRRLVRIGQKLEIYPNSARQSFSQAAAELNARTGPDRGRDR
jgi:uncharacterized cupin superfamily protein